MSAAPSQSTACPLKRSLEEPSTSATSAKRPKPSTAAAEDKDVTLEQPASKRLGFPDLPGELRDIIYKHALIEECAITPFYRKRCKWKRRPLQTQPPLTEPSRQIRVVFVGLWLSVLGESIGRRNVAHLTKLIFASSGSQLFHVELSIKYDQSRITLRTMDPFSDETEQLLSKTLRRVVEKRKGNELSVDELVALKDTVYNQSCQARGLNDANSIGTILVGHAWRGKALAIAIDRNTT